MAKHDELVNKCVQMEKERVQIKKLAKSRMVSDKEMIDSLKKKDYLKKKLDNEKEKNKLARMDI
jgi:hypothetical protein